MNKIKTLAIGFAIFYAWHLLAGIVDRKLPVLRDTANKLIP